MGGSFFSDFWAMVVEMFQADFGEYENLGISNRGLKTLRTAVIAFFIAVMIAAVVISVKRRLFGGLVHRLQEGECFSAEQAKTLDELGLRNRIAVKMALRMGGQYRRIVRCVEEETYQEKVVKIQAQNAADYAAGEARNPYRKMPGFVYDFSHNHFYIPEEARIKASRKYELKGTGPLSLVLILVGSFLAMVVLVCLLPDLVQLADNFVGILKDK